MYQRYKRTCTIPNRSHDVEATSIPSIHSLPGAISLKRRGIIATRAVATFASSGQKLVHFGIPATRIAYTSTSTQKMASTKPLKTDWTADDEGELIRRPTMVFFPWSYGLF
jgi:hypothetical protein